MQFQTYQKYKPSGIDWLGEIPERWEVKRIKDLFSLITDRAHIDNNFQLLSIYTSIGVEPREDMEQRGNKSVTTDGYWRVKKGDFIVNKLLAWMGAIALSNYEGVTSPAYDILRKKHVLCAEYYEYFFRARLAQLEFKKHSRGIMDVRLRLYFDKFGSISFPYQNITEQTAIAEFLDQHTALIDKKIELLKAKKQSYTELRQTLINEVVTKGLDTTVEMKKSEIGWIGQIPKHWEVKRINWISSITRGNSSFKKDELLKNGEYIALQYGKTYKVDEVNETFNFYVNSEFYKPDQVVRHGDIILVSTSETIEDLGHTCFYDRKDLGLIGGEQILLKPKRKFIYEKYLYYYSKAFCKELRKYSTGLKVFRFNIDDLKNINIPIPNKQIQTAIANYLDEKTGKIDTIIGKIDENIAILEEFKKTLINDAVTGKIKVD